MQTRLFALIKGSSRNLKQIKGADPNRIYFLDIFYKAQIRVRFSLDLS
jgi:hypothetical protein